MTKRQLYLSIFALLVVLPLSTLAVYKVPTTVTKSQTALELINKAVDKFIFSCQVDIPTEPVYAGQLISIDVPGQVDLNQLFAVNIKIKNLGNVPWFSSDSGCLRQSTTYLGTTLYSGS